MLWNRLQGLPGGKAVFSRILSSLVPYTGTISPEILELGGGFARVRMRDRKRVRNHLRSIHALAIANLGELASGLSMYSDLPDGLRGIITGLSTEYLKKARGTLTAECRTPPLQPGEDRQLELVSEVKDASGSVVARVTATWKISAVKS